jgi:hypothetical protein
VLVPLERGGKQDFLAVCCGMLPNMVTIFEQKM